MNVISTDVLQRHTPKANTPMCVLTRVQTQTAQKASDVLNSNICHSSFRIYTHNRRIHTTQKGRYHRTVSTKNMKSTPPKMTSVPRPIPTQQKTPAMQVLYLNETSITPFLPRTPQKTQAGYVCSAVSITRHQAYLKLVVRVGAHLPPCCCGGGGGYEPIGGDGAGAYEGLGPMGGGPPPPPGPLRPRPAPPAPPAP